MRRAAKKDTSPTRVSDLFGVYKERLRAPQGSVIHEVVEVVYEVTGLQVDKKYFTYNVHTKTIGCTATSMIRTEIRLRQKEITHALADRLGERNVPDFFI
jgi:hypothetical protein